MLWGSQHYVAPVADGRAAAAFAFRVQNKGPSWHALATHTGIGGARTGNSGQGCGGPGSSAMACCARVTCWPAAAEAAAALAEAVE
jgi:hypothetical protein